MNILKFFSSKEKYVLSYHSARITGKGLKSLSRSESHFPYDENYIRGFLKWTRLRNKSKSYNYPKPLGVHIEDI